MEFCWIYRPVKRLLPPGHPFFEEGDIYCNILRKQVNLSEDIIDACIESSLPEFKCSVHGCNEYFVNTQRFETHYKSCHWNSCRLCRKSFHTSYLLDLHILENHDTLFQLIAKKKDMYRCLVESCPDKFSGEEQRKSHLVKIHQYPSDFRFNRPSRSQKKIKRQQANACEKQTKPHNGTVVDTMDMDTTQASNQNHLVPSSEETQLNQKQRMPRSICFGRGSSRGFQRGGAPKGQGRGKNNNKKNKTKPSSVEVTMEDVS